MKAICVVVSPEIIQLPREVERVAEEHAIEAF
jgi:hypothetical protein